MDYISYYRGILHRDDIIYEAGLIIGITETHKSEHYFFLGSMRKRYKNIISREPVSKEVINKAKKLTKEIINEAIESGAIRHSDFLEHNGILTARGKFKVFQKDVFIRNNKATKITDDLVNFTISSFFNAIKFAFDARIYTVKRIVLGQYLGFEKLISEYALTLLPNIQLLITGIKPMLDFDMYAQIKSLSSLCCGRYSMDKSKLSNNNTTRFQHFAQYAHFMELTLLQKPMKKYDSVYLPAKDKYKIGTCIHECPDNSLDYYESKLLSREEALRYEISHVSSFDMVCRYVNKYRKWAQYFELINGGLSPQEYDKILEYKGDPYIVKRTIKSDNQ